MSASQPTDLPPALASAAASLHLWKTWVDALPPHDALQAIFEHGDVLARFGAAAPAPLRLGVLANLRALLGAALRQAGGRFLTPYAFVRALKAGRMPGPAVAARGVVRLLTVHGAKGLEAPVVVLLDTDAMPARAGVMGVLCEWPAEAPAPWRFAFLASEARPPVCCEAALAHEQAERAREELNALYVAMTRAQQTLVISSVVPATPGAASWWQRLLPHCAVLPVPEPAGALPADEALVFSLRTLPGGPPDRAPQRRPAPTASAGSAESRLGEAMHRWLELWRPGQPAGGPARLRLLARQFSLDAAAARRAEAMAQDILRGEGAWAWDAGTVDWQGTEVELFHQGELLRMDRLVRRRDSGEWWVLDFKSGSRPQDDEGLRAQMRRYQLAVREAAPGAVVRAAFLTGQGRLVEVE